MAGVTMVLMVYTLIATSLEMTAVTVTQQNQPKVVKIVSLILHLMVLNVVTLHGMHLVCHVLI